MLRDGSPFRGGISFQPAELCKLILILFLSYFLSKREVENLSLFKEILPMGVITLVPFLLVLMQPDLGNSIGYLVIFIVVCWFGHINYKHALIGLVIIIMRKRNSLYSYVKYHEEVKQFMASKHKAYWLDRVDAVLLPDQASEKATYHMKQSVKAIGSGSLEGDGYLSHGTSVQSGQVPYTYSDSIFVVVGERIWIYRSISVTHTLLSSHLSNDHYCAEHPQPNRHLHHRWYYGYVSISSFRKHWDADRYHANYGDNPSVYQLWRHFAIDQHDIYRLCSKYKNL